MKRYTNNLLDNHAKLNPLKVDELEGGKVYYDLLNDRNDMVMHDPKTQEEIRIMLESMSSEFKRRTPPPSEGYIKQWVADSQKKKGKLLEAEILDFQFCEHPDILY